MGEELELLALYEVDKVVACLKSVIGSQAQRSGAIPPGSPARSCLRYQQWLNRIILGIRYLDTGYFDSEPSNTKRVMQRIRGSKLKLRRAVPPLQSKELQLMHKMC